MATAFLKKKSGTAKAGPARQSFAPMVCS